MYPKYFGLTESGFSITPDPQYLFLSDQHREALVHLQFGAGEDGGFVLLTGEVGTGKTTVCRAFLEQIPERVDLALIFNPALSSRELLQAVCSEFRIPVALESSSSRQLVSALNEYLLRAHAAGRRPLLMIDEAQNLSPEVLEQVRLLTNLETDKHKLLQIFLVGQPELRELLQQRGLRQLAQRITARYHLGPLKRRETRAYVRHRLRVAGAERELFTGPALRLVHRRTGGVPRLINILCERALLGAYATGRQQATWSIVARAARELAGNSGRRSPPPDGLARLGAWALAAFVALSLGFAGYWLGSTESTNPVVALSQPTPGRPEIVPISPIYASAVEPLDAVVPPEAAEPLLPHKTEPAYPPVFEMAVSAAAVQPVSEMAQSESPKLAADQPEAARPPVLTPPEADSGRSQSADSPAVADPEWREFRAQALGLPLAGRKLAMQRLMTRWGIVFSERDLRDPCEVAEMDLAACLVRRAGWTRLLEFNRPALLRLDGGRNQALYALLIGFRGDAALIDLGDREQLLPLEQLDRYWSGDFILLWRIPPGGERLVNERASSRSRKWLAEQLAPLVGGARDADLGALVRRFQQQQGLQVDGVAGPETMIRLNALSDRPGIPQLRRGG
jgi:general secretion pathway protein A